MLDFKNKINEINKHLTNANQEDFLDIKIEMFRKEGDDRYIDVIFGTIGTPDFAKVIVSFKNPDFIKSLLYPMIETYNEYDKQIIQIASLEEIKDIAGVKLYEEYEFKNSTLFKISIDPENDVSTYIIAEDISFQLINNHTKSIFSHELPKDIDTTNSKEVVKYIKEKIKK